MNKEGNLRNGKHIAGICTVGEQNETGEGNLFITCFGCGRGEQYSSYTYSCQRTGKKVIKVSTIEFMYSNSSPESRFFYVG